MLSVNVCMLCSCVLVTVRCCTLVSVYMFYAGQGLDKLMTSEMKFLRKGVEIAKDMALEVQTLVCAHSFMSFCYLPSCFFRKMNFHFALTSVFTMYDFHIIFLSNIMS